MFLLAVYVLVCGLVDADFWYKQTVLPGLMMLAIPAELACLRTLGSKTENGRALCEVEGRIITAVVYIERRKPPFLSFCLWSGVPIPCPAQK